ncbi:hypothetical protein ACFFSH_30475 [Streptomyces filamentosus]|uniref:Uncharacterized protein n=1 Tax=Streptomyces filamentosus TaxID=67294 RepID=A0A919BZB3_STRFL|nr:hypothetical protein [Streptomyces filamentosus]GHG28460.1 hypothetical protein GCM10017667_77050 [Streptomyces filamentosus]
MVEELTEAVVRAAGAAARGVASLLSVPETYSAAAELAATEAERPRERPADKKKTDDETAKNGEDRAEG